MEFDLKNSKEIRISKKIDKIISKNTSLIKWVLHALELEKKNKYMQKKLEKHSNDFKWILR